MRVRKKMNELQKIEFDILLKIDKICKENNIQYFLAYGTALGAVRHKGFIPWDDDVDVIMMREDYEKFCSLPKELIPKDLFLQTVFSDKLYPYPFAKLRKRNTAYVEEGLEHLEMNHGIFVDIFPLDYIPRKKHLQIFQRIWSEYLWILLARNRVDGVKKIISLFFNFMIPKNRYLKHIKKIEKRMKCNSSCSKKVALMSYGGRTQYAKQHFSVNDFEIVYMEFEKHMFPMPKGYDRLLKQVYGDYMVLPPEEKRVTHKGYFVSFCEDYKKNDCNL